MFVNSMDAKMNQTGRKSEIWQNNAWVRDYEEVEQLTYNPADQITERINIAWDPSSNLLKPYQKEVYHTFRVMGTDKDKALAEVKIFPNPAAEFITVQLTTNEPTQANLTDLTGREV